MLEWDAAHQKAEALIATVTKDVFEDFYNSNRRKRMLLDETEEDEDEADHIICHCKKCRPSKHDHGRAWMCIQPDYLGPNPIDTDKQFQEMYRLTKGCIEKPIVTCCRHKPEASFVALNWMQMEKAGIRVECKVLGILRCVAFGCSGVAFRDYHQMTRNTFSENLKAFYGAIIAEDEPVLHILRPQQGKGLPHERQIVVVVRRKMNPIDGSQRAHIGPKTSSWISTSTFCYPRNSFSGAMEPSSR